MENKKLFNNNDTIAKNILLFINKNTLDFTKSFLSLILNFNHPSFLNPIHHIISFISFVFILLPIWFFLNVFNLIFINMFINKNYLLFFVLIIIYFLITKNTLKK